MKRRINGWIYRLISATELQSTGEWRVSELTNSYSHYQPDNNYRLTGKPVIFVGEEIIQNIIRNILQDIADIRWEKGLTELL